MALAPLVGYADVPGYGLIFYVIDSATDDSDIIDHRDGLTTRRFFVEPGLRYHVRQVLAVAITVLIDETDANPASMTTHSANLPAKALTKFSEICGVFGSKGVTVGKSDIWHGCRIWMMYRP